LAANRQTFFSSLPREDIFPEIKALLHSVVLTSNRTKNVCNDTPIETCVELARFQMLHFSFLL
jgi:hypothetical protein